MAIVPRKIILSDVSNDECIESALETLSSYCSEYQVDVPEDSLRKCVEHLLYVLQVNEYINLTSITDFDEALVLHSLDSLFYLKLMDKPFRNVLDMGSGAGFPGIPLALSLDVPVVMVDSVNKKVNAVNEFIKQLGIENAVATHDRIEAHAAQFPRSYDCVVARALAPLPVLLEYARPLLRNKGRLIVSKGSPSDEELLSTTHLLPLLGYSSSTTYDTELPHGLGHRCLMSFDVVKPSSVKLPRAVGLARKKPLA